ncbi:MAG: hypothetical protein R6X13_08760 [bacterium]
MIALLSGQPHWRSLLQQEGVPYGAIDAATAVETTAPVLVLDRRPVGPELKTLDRQLRAGRAVLAGSDSIPVLLGRSRSRRVYIRFIAPDSSSQFSKLGLLDIDQWTHVPAGAQAGITDGGYGAVFVGSIGNAPVAILPFELEHLLSRTESATRHFHLVSGRSPAEAVSSVARGEVRRLIGNCLRGLLDRLGLPYVRLSPFPLGCRGLGALRVDTDEAIGAALDPMVDLARRLNLTFTWFINTSLMLGKTALPDALTDGRQDVQLHCYRHRAYSDYRRALSDIKTGLQYLAAADVRPSGYAAPYGEWSPGLQRAICDAGLDYSSEFGFAYDDLPVWPILGVDESRALQVPVHPICIGSLRRARATSEQMKQYYGELIQHRFARREPCLLYDHPASRQAGVLGTVLEDLRQTCGRWTTLTEYASWFRLRQRFAYTAEASPKRLSLVAGNVAERAEVIVEREGRETWVELADSDLDLQALNWQALPTGGRPPRPDRTVRQFDLRTAVRDVRTSWRRALQKRQREL